MLHQQLQLMQIHDLQTFTLTCMGGSSWQDTHSSTQTSCEQPSQLHYSSITTRTTATQLRSYLHSAAACITAACIAAAAAAAGHPQALCKCSGQPAVGLEAHHQVSLGQVAGQGGAVTLRQAARDHHLAALAISVQPSCLNDGLVAAVTAAGKTAGGVSGQVQASAKQ
jgi:hypothetical protein